MGVRNQMSSIVEGTKTLRKTDPTLMGYAIVTIYMECTPSMMVVPMRLHDDKAPPVAVKKNPRWHEDLVRRLETGTVPSSGN